LEDETKTQELIQELEDRGYSKAADTLEHFRFKLMELQVVLQRTLETNQDYKRTGKD